jgi:two-component system chemotaxis response regulator CheB
MVVDDSVVVRGLLSRWVSQHGSMEVIGTASNGRLALDKLETLDPDAIVLDLDMPELDGIAALPLILRKRPNVSVLVTSTLTARNAEISLKCLSLGAVDYLPKPESNRDLTTSQSFRHELVAKLDAIGTARRRRGARPSEPPAGTGRLRRVAQPALRVPTAPRCIVIGASTGGPQAIAQLLGDIGPVVDRVPVLIVQHMPPIFTAVFAEHLKNQTGHVVREPFDGERLLPGTVYIAPGGRHMGVTRINGHPAVRLDDGPPVNYCRPAVDVLFQEAAEVFGSSALAVILTGMGSDGTRGARVLSDAGATIVAQDEASSIVWGMPGNVVRAGLANAVLPLSDISGAMKDLMRERSA